MTPEQVLEVLRDGRYHSGSEIAKQQGATRARVWQCIEQLQSWGIEIWRVRGKGYRLSPDMELVERSAVLALLEGVAREQLKLADFALDIPSTNSHLLECPSVDGYSLMFAEHQSAGKGRHGRVWKSPLAQNLSFSIAKQVDHLSAIQALSLTVGQSVAQVLRDMGVPVQLKWPNDVYIDGKKAAGILVELKTMEDRSAKVVIGVGVNVNASYKAEDIAQQSTHINEWLAKPISRTELLAKLLNQIIADVDDHLAGGREALLKKWSIFDWLHGKDVNLLRAGEVVESGKAVGLDDLGSLLIENDDGEVSAIAHGEVSVRPK
ncbi:biotin--[acetyl-CoA-carboxylase] ligase [Salinibius halmophilus]|uniref:biotin--[acetyl-CoA-carboxylase] ligase n=1 Tax=Salinibius halmophilus TaxID=1853216 RepID=UPI000E66335C|nr:biotin--[acetyl-CoA-carboxylase] ligase [Salinibius halmophilus]